MRKNMNNADIVGCALRGEDAMTKNGNMSTDSFRPGFSRYGAPYTGSLPMPFQRILNAAFAAGTVTQVIYSYSTPIAWHDTDYGWIIPEVTYSPTTSTKHQTHLYRLHGRRVILPYDATQADGVRVMDGRMEFVRGTGKNYGRAVATRPGPNYVAGE